MVVVSFVVIWGVFALVMDFREVMLTSPPELAHCGGGVNANLEKVYILIFFAPFPKQ